MFNPFKRKEKAVEREFEYDVYPESEPGCTGLNPLRFHQAAGFVFYDPDERCTLCKGLMLKGHVGECLHCQTLSPLDRAYLQAEGA